MKARLVEKIMTDGSVVWDVEMWKHDHQEAIVLSGITEKKAVEFINGVRRLMESCTVEHLVCEETLFNQPHC